MQSDPTASACRHWLSAVGQRGLGPCRQVVCATAKRLRGVWWCLASKGWWVAAPKGGEAVACCVEAGAAPTIPCGARMLAGSVGLCVDVWRLRLLWRPRFAVAGQLGGQPPAGHKADTVHGAHCVLQLVVIKLPLPLVCAASASCCRRLRRQHLAVPKPCNCVQPAQICITATFS